MKNKSSTTRLKEAIQLLKEDNDFNKQMLVKEFHQTYESLKPANLLKSTLSEVVSSPVLLEKILGTTLGIATGYLSKKILVAGSENKFRKLLGSILQFEVTNLVKRNPKAIKFIGEFIYKSIFRKRKYNRELNKEENYWEEELRT